MICIAQNERYYLKLPFISLWKSVGNDNLGEDPVFKGFTVLENLDVGTIRQK